MHREQAKCVTFRSLRSNDSCCLVTAHPLDYDRIYLGSNNRSLSATGINNAAHWSCINCVCGGWPLVKHGEHTEVTSISCSQRIQNGGNGCGASSPPANGLSAQVKHSSPQPTLSDYPNQIGESDIVPTAEDYKGNFTEVPHLG